MGRTNSLPNSHMFYPPHPFGPSSPTSAQHVAQSREPQHLAGSHRAKSGRDLNYTLCNLTFAWKAAGNVQWGQHLWSAVILYSYWLCVQAPETRCVHSRRSFPSSWPSPTATQTLRAFHNNLQQDAHSVDRWLCWPDPQSVKKVYFVTRDLLRDLLWPKLSQFYY